MLTIYGVYQSRASRVYWMAEELGIAYESVPVIQARMLADPLAEGARINTASPAFHAINPQGLIPCIVDDGLLLIESLAITHYLAEKHGGPLAPQTAAERGQMLQWSLLAGTTIEPQSVQVVYLYDNGSQDTPGGKDTIAVATRLLKKPLALVEAQLAKADFLVGNRFTVADLNMSEVMRYVMSETDFMAHYPHILAWYERCHARPAFQRMWAVREKESV
jgi:glutathione S-transferase